MQKAIVGSLSILICFLFPAKISAQGVPARDSISRNGYELIVINKDSLFSPVTKQRMVEAFFTVYPAEAKRFNPEAARKVTFIIDTAYKGVAATGNGVVRYNPAWLKSHPEDIDVVTHEVMHIVQSYGRGGGPGWLTEGIADYVRYTFGVNNLQGKWALPDYKEGQSYTNSYRITARFLVWLEQQGNKTVVDSLDKAARAHTYTPEIWKELTGKTLDELWNAYTANPTVQLTYK
ncbi:MAG: secretory protein [Williamsia sp.]|nr:secretory protein [Williamsia sp.]